MSSLWELLRRFTELLIWWTVIQPWEGALRVRLGNHIKVLPPGLHYKGKLK